MRSLEDLECVSDPEVDLYDDDDVERSKLPRPRRSKSVDFSTFVECVEVPRYKRASKAKYHKLTTLQKMAIRVELNEFKMKEMSVHNESRKNTLFYDVDRFKPRFGLFFKTVFSKK